MNEGEIFYRTEYPDKLQYVFSSPYLKEVWIRTDHENTNTLYDYALQYKSSYGLKINGVSNTPLGSEDLSNRYMIKKTNEQKEILGYACFKYVFETKFGVYQAFEKGYFWATEAFDLRSYKNGFNYLGSCYLKSDIGLALEGEEFPDVWSTITFSAVEITENKPPLNHFEIPASYLQKKKD